METSHLLHLVSLPNDMKIPWPQPFEDGDVGSLPPDFEDVVEVVEVKTLLKGKAKAVLETVGRSSAKLEWAADKSVHWWYVFGSGQPAENFESQPTHAARRDGRRNQVAVELLAAKQEDTLVEDLKAAVSTLTEQIFAVRIRDKKPQYKNIRCSCGRSGRWKRIAQNEIFK